MKRMFTFVSLIIISIMIIVGLASTKASATSDGAMAYIVMKDYVKARLKTPSVAKFPSAWTHPYTEFTKSIGNNRYAIKSWVDTQNGFGAMVRVFYVGIVRKVSKNNWELELLKFFQ